MKKNIIILAVVLVVAIGGYVLRNNSNSTPAKITKITKIITTPIPSQRAEPTDFTASFEIFTHGTKRIFTQAMYHQQSPEVFIQAIDPSIVYVKKTGTTWSDFFATLPFSLKKDCLITGTKQIFCTNDQQTLRFFLNGTESPDALDKEIQPQDHLRVTYGD